jgi:hypothetical protein
VELYPIRFPTSGQPSVCGAMGLHPVELGVTIVQNVAVKGTTVVYGVGCGTVRCVTCIVVRVRLLRASWMELRVCVLDWDRDPTPLCSPPWHQRPGTPRET